MQKSYWFFFVASLLFSVISNAHGGAVLNSIEAAKHLYVIGHQTLVVEEEERSYSDIALNAVVGLAHLKFIHSYWKSYRKQAPDSVLLLAVANTAILVDLYTDIKTTADYVTQEFSFWTAPIYLAGPPCALYNIVSTISQLRKYSAKTHA